ncbi:MAG: DUF3606 domain-containing protein [Pseudoxanthomonas sp.]
MNVRLSDTDPPDACRISLREPREVQYWTTHLGISLNQLRQAIDAVGASPAHVEAWVKYQSQATA